MKAIHLHARGGPEQLFYEDAPRPQLKPGDALVHVCACAVTPTELSWPTTYTTHEGASLPSIPGHEVAGVVEAVGPNGNGAKTTPAREPRAVRHPSLPTSGKPGALVWGPRVGD